MGTGLPHLAPRAISRGPPVLLISILPPGGCTKQSLPGERHEVGEGDVFHPCWPQDRGTSAHHLPKPVFQSQPSCPQNHLMKMPREKRRFFWVTMKLSIKSQTQG